MARSVTYLVLYGSIPKENDVERCPFRHLFAAMLHRAVLDLESSDKEDLRTARAWIQNGEIGKVSFNRVCEVLSLTDNEITYVKKLAYEARD